MIDFETNRRGVVLEYEPEFNGAAWVLQQLRVHKRVRISRAFSFLKSDLIKGPTSESDEADEPIFRFRFAVREKGYFRIPGRILGVKNDVLIADEGITLDRKLFVAERNVGIFRRIAKVKQDSHEIIIGGTHDDSIPIAAFRELLAKFPNSLELDRYASARVETILGEYFDNLQSARESYETYLSKRRSVVSDVPLEQEELLQAEIDKFCYLRDTISSWLGGAGSYTEKDWQRLILKVILLLFPKYVVVLENVKIADFYSEPAKRKNRFIDICLVDASGNLDVLEIKKPFDDILLSHGLYRGNSVPTKTLSGTIMQAEKYLFHLSKWGIEGERELSKRYRAQLPPDMEIRITNPKAMLLLGRDRLRNGRSALSESQAFDFEVIKRKYANMMDIITYDDLLRRIDKIIESLSRRKQKMA